MDAVAGSSFGAMLRRFRLVAGLTQAALAARAGVSERAINDLERDPRRAPRLETVTLLADALSLSSSDRAQLLVAARRETLAPEHPPVAESSLTSLAPISQNAVTARADVVPISPAAAAWSSSGKAPRPPGPFVGRAREVATVCARLREPDTRLLTLTGPGGIGKSRLALQVATMLESAYADGVRFVPLESITDPALVLPTIAAALDIPESAHHSSLERLALAIGARELLLVLDNFEQVAPAAMELERLLAVCAALTVLLTSRVALHLAREREYVVPPLSVPAPTDVWAPTDLLGYDAVALLIQCAQARAPDFVLTPANAHAVAAICARLEGVPLAIQLAAARIKLLPPVALQARLDQQLALLTGGPVDAPERQRTVRATLDWSYRLLSQPQQALFRRLAVFVGGWTLDAAEAICAGGDVKREDILDQLCHLVDHSLVLVDEQGDGARYRLLETVRQYALEALRDTGEEAELRNQHLAWFLRQAEEADAQTWIVPNFATMRVLKPDIDNFRVALEWSKRDMSGQTTLRLISAYHSLWHAAGAISEGRRALRLALAHADPSARTSAGALAAMSAGSLASLQTDPAEARPQLELALETFHALGDERNAVRALTIAARARHWAGNETAFAEAREEALSVCRRLGDPRALCETLWLWADLTLDQGDYVAARRQLEECHAACRQLNDAILRSFPLISLARVACKEGDLTRARAYAEEGLALRDGALPWLVAVALTSLGEVERCADHDERAAELFTQALMIFRAQDDGAGIAWSLHNLGQVALRAAEPRRAAALFAEALTARRQHGYTPGIASELAGMAGVCCLTGKHVQAARLLGAADVLLERSGSVLAPADERAYQRDLASFRVQIESGALTEAWATGRALPLEQAIAEALVVVG